MVFRVRCFKCGAFEARLILGGREILHARCETCGTNLLAEVLDLEAEVEESKKCGIVNRRKPDRERRITSTTVAAITD
ncbi:MAG: hypothetical protein ACNA8W_06755 [Bradymonadaceae bacterium]